MKLYFIPFACSLATRIAINEAELDADFIQVTPGEKLPDGRDFAAVSPMGYVPAMEAGAVTLSEGPAVLTYIADLAAEGVLAPAPYTAERYELTKWLNFISTEIQKPLIFTFFIPGDDAIAVIRDMVTGRFAMLGGIIGDGHVLGDRYTVADALLYVTLRWATMLGMKLPANIPAYMQHIEARPAVRQALKEEGLA